MLLKAVIFLLTVAILVIEIEAHRGWRGRWGKCHPKCHKGCRKVRTGKFCHECECEPVCPYLKCEEGCELEKVPEEPCPTCVCKEEEVPALDYGEAWARCYPKCEKGCRKFFTAKGCYKCDCRPICPYLQCKEGCSLEKLPGKPCPFCVCKEEEVPAIDYEEALARCYPKCGKGCRKHFTVKGCYKCDCKPVCPYLKCEEGCSLEKSPEEPCPVCVCKEEEIPVLDIGESFAKCYPKCGKFCRKVFTAKGCYKCDCKPVCPYLKCKEGCSLEKPPGEPCSSCVCKEEDEPRLDNREAFAKCYPKCEQGCRKIFTAKGCYKCNCEPICPELKCKEGCSEEKLQGQPCPSCVCKEEEVPALDFGEARAKCYPKCEKGCKKVFTRNGCYECKCEPVCPELKCKEGCTEETLQGQQCPSCVCKEEEEPALDFGEAFVKCHPECEKGCRKVLTKNKCYKCECEPVCSELKCEEGCSPEKLPEQPCPSCVCKEEEVPALDVGEGRERCYPKCEKGCQKVFTDKGCYECDCKPVCPELKCEDGCSSEQLPGESCPSCVCKEEDFPAIDQRRRNCYPKCAKGCSEVFTEDGCIECDCKPICPQIHCEDKCSLQQLPGEPCPSCVCFDQGLLALEDASPEQVACEPPKCQPGCKVQTTFEGICPDCECEEEVLEK